MCRNRTIYDFCSSQIIQRQEEKIQEMVAIMQKAIKLDDDDFEVVKKDQEDIRRLIEENRGLREILDISKKIGHLNDNGNHENKSETEKSEKTEKISVETQTDANANKC